MSVQPIAAPAPVARAVPADRTLALRILGGIGAAAGLLFAGMEVWQQAAGLSSGSGGFADRANQSLFALATAGYVALAVGLHLSRPGGSGRIARWFPALLGAGWFAILVGGFLELSGSVGPEADPLSSIGGWAQVVALIGLAITVARAGRWSGWRRYAPLGLTVYVVGGLMAPSFAGVDPGPIGVSLWALGYAGLGVALIVEALPAARRPRSAVVLLGLAVAAGTVVALGITTAPAAATPQPPINVVQNPHGIGATTPGDGGPGYGYPSIGGSSQPGPISTWDQTRGGTGDQGPLSARDQTLGSDASN
jgi:hypothetical protein